MLLTQKMIWKPHNCSLCLDKVYVRLNENGNEISLKNCLQKNILLVLGIKTRGTNHLKASGFSLSYY